MRVSNSRVQCSHSKVQFSTLECSDHECKVTPELYRTLDEWVDDGWSYTLYAVTIIYIHIYIYIYTQGQNLIL